MGQLGPTWEKVKLTNLMTVDLLPYGNSRESQAESKWTFECQHGVNECWGNLLETCVIHYYPNTTQHLDIIRCIEEDFVITMGYSWKDTLSKCSQSHGVDISKITACTEGKEGNSLEHIVATFTGAHDYVPWVLIDGKHDADAEKNLLTQVCKAYKGTPPRVCHKLL
ncbi:hypothetical protein RRG08_011488 [Elysia crispata]|uniref:Gamma-interferon-inducible lysosomal thiol reductase n=1 Tax=Elysia crispata TaxID=231223 RepID=A0AAE1B9W9_9GAST|nr:hypothetical protein RRG08_011488 [Elysia crispata]